MYNECWIVIWSKVTVERRSEKRGPSLVYQFQHSVESGDASDEEAPPCDPKSNNLIQKEWLKAINMLVVMEIKDSLKRHAIMVIAKKLAWHVQTYSTIKLKIFFSVIYSYGFNIQ